MPRRRSRRCRRRLRRAPRGRRPADRRRRPQLGRLRAAGAGGLLACGKSGRRRCVCRDRTERALSQRRSRCDLAGAEGAFGTAVATDVELPAAPMDLARSLDRAQPAGGLPEPLPAMPYALVATERRLFAGFADGQLWASADRGESWHACPLEGERLERINALVNTAA